MSTLESPTLSLSARIDRYKLKYNTKFFTYSLNLDKFEGITELLQSISDQRPDLVFYSSPSVSTYILRENSQDFEFLNFLPSQLEFEIGLDEFKSRFSLVPRIELPNYTIRTANYNERQCAAVLEPSKESSILFYRGVLIQGGQISLFDPSKNLKEVFNV